MLTAIKIGSNIKKIRLVLKISLMTVSHITEIEYSHLYKIENGKVNTSVMNLMKISSALNIPINIFFLKEINMNKTELEKYNKEMNLYFDYNKDLTYFI